ncbi:MAG: hypothetical protein ACREBR_00810 [bacterium]
MSKVGDIGCRELLPLAVCSEQLADPRKSAGKLSLDCLRLPKRLQRQRHAPAREAELDRPVGLTLC